MSQPPQQQNPPGHTDEMDPRPDHGENSYRGSGRLTGKAAIITGADSGIGRAVAIAFAREGADVVIRTPGDERSCCPVISPIRRTVAASSTGRSRSSAASTSWWPTPHSR